MPTTKTVSTCTSVEEEGSHVFSIFGYSKHRGAGKCVTSGVFSVGGHDWAIRFYPDGANMHQPYRHNLRNSDYIAVYVELLSKDATAHASCDLRLVDQHTGRSTSVSKTAARLFSQRNNASLAPQHGAFKLRSEFEASAYLRDDNLAIECVVTVIKEARVSETKPWPGKIEAPPTDITAHLGRLLETEVAADVTFVVGEETFAAHRLVLAMRSPVFMAEFFGPMRETKATQQPAIPIGDMHPEVFRSLLHFIYTDSLPAMDDHLEDDNDDNEMIRHLLAAADRYAMDRLKVVCQSILCEGIDVQNVAATLALAEQHHCAMLKNACIDFISSWNMDDVVATQGFVDLRTSCRPSVLIDALVRVNFFCRA